MPSRAPVSPVVARFAAKTHSVSRIGPTNGSRESWYQLGNPVTIAGKPGVEYVLTRLQGTLRVNNSVADALANWDVYVTYNPSPTAPGEVQVTNCYPRTIGGLARSEVTDSSGGQAFDLAANVSYGFNADLYVRFRVFEETNTETPGTDQLDNVAIDDLILTYYERQILTQRRPRRVVQ